MTSPIESIIFDFGGVLVGWDPRNLYRHYFPGQPQAMEDFLTEINFSEWNLQQDKGRRFAEATALLSAEFPQHAHLINAYFENYEKSITGPIEGSVAILKLLKAKRYSLYGLTNWSNETFPRARKQYDFFDLFDDIIVSGDINMLKPDPAIFDFTLQKIGRTAEECAYIDDSLPNVRQANKMNFNGIHFTSAAQLEKDLTRLGLL
jgi:2-haloacid dehalogenase